ncbi:MAG: MFS transporter [Alphaproteobacteria bacterium]|nr:MFS transporter [Alphaproteobacteria bacterium]
MPLVILLKKCIIGYSYGVSFPITIVILDYWLKECGVTNSTIGLFSLFHLPFALKLLFAPIIDRYKIPYLSKKIGHRCSWVLVSQCALITGIMCMAQSDPKSNILQLMCFASITALADGFQNIALYPYQISDITKEQFGYTAGIVSFGHRIGSISIKVATLYCAHFWGWKIAYECAACMVLCCMISIFFMKEPVITDDFKESNKKNIHALSSHIKEILKEIKHVANKRYIMLTLILYKATDFTIQKMSRVFCLDIGFSKLEIANIVQFFGSIAVVAGGFLAGFFIKKYGTLYSMMIISMMHMCFLFSYIILNYVGNDTNILCAIIFLEGVSGGAVSAAFIAFLYENCRNGSQYALLWAIHELSGTVFRFLSGFLADQFSWNTFFILTPLLSVPGILLLRKMIKIKNELNTNL